MSEQLTTLPAGQKVIQAGPNEQGGIFIALADTDQPLPKDKDPKITLCFAEESVKHEMLEVALAALTNHFAVEATIVVSEEKYKKLKRLYITDAHR